MIFGKIINKFVVRPIHFNQRLFTSFIIGTNNVNQSDLESMLKASKGLNNLVKTYQIKNFTVGLSSTKIIEDLNYNYYENELKTSILIGRITNEKQLSIIARTLLQCDYKLELEKEVNNLKGAQLIYELFEKYGPSIFSLMEGNFSFVIINHCDSKLEVFNDKLGTMPLYYSKQLGTNWIFNEAKILTAHPHSSLELKPFNSLHLAESHASDFTAFKNVFKVPAGFSLVTYQNFGVKINEKFYELKPSYFSIQNNVIIPEFYKKMLNSILRDSIESSLNEANEATLLLSGGLDSSLVTSMAKRITSNLTSISVGTELSNEFKWAKIVSDFVGTNHHELILSNDQVIDGIINSCYENEIFDGFSAEVQSPLYNLVKHIASLGKNRVLTGYGADLLFGGVIPLDTNISQVNTILNKQINRTKWTGEFHPFIANKYSIHLDHPFWDSRLISFALSLDGSFKKNSHEVKLILREMASQYKYLPDEIAWRKKIGVNEATSVISVFSQFLGLKTDLNYQLKNLFVYNVFKQLFQEKKTLNSIDIKHLAGINFNKTNEIKPPQPLESIDKTDENLFKAEIKDKIMLIEFNQLNKHNPINHKLEKFIKKHLLLAENNDEVDAIIITGGIDKSFSAGGDFNEVKNLKTEQQVDDFIQRIYDLYITSLQITKPIIGAIDHFAIGIGFQLALTFDMRIGTNRCAFIMPELKYGLSCTVGSCMLEHFFGRALATKLIYECNSLNAQELYDMHLLNKIVEPNDLLTEAFKLAKQLGEYPKNAFQNTKKATNKRFIYFLNNSIQDSKYAHKKSILSGENEKHFKNILKNKF